MIDSRSKLRGIKPSLMAGFYYFFLIHMEISLIEFWVFRLTLLSNKGRFTIYIKLLLPFKFLVIIRSQDVLINAQKYRHD